MRHAVRGEFLRRCAALLTLVAALPCVGATAANAPATTQASPQSAPQLTVALLDFSTDTPGTPDLGAQIGDVLTATLSGQPGYTLVDRSSLTRVLKEHELNLTGLIDTDKGTKIGKLVGAKILVSGRVFVQDKQIFMIAKLIGTETSLVDGFIVKGETSSKLSRVGFPSTTFAASRMWLALSRHTYGAVSTHSRGTPSC